MLSCFLAARVRESSPVRQNSHQCRFAAARRLLSACICWYCCSVMVVPGAAAAATTPVLADAAPGCRTLPCTASEPYSLSCITVTEGLIISCVLWVDS